MIEPRERRRRATAQALVLPLALRSPAAWSARQVIQVWSNTDRQVAEPLIEGFERAHPGYRVEYDQFGSTELYARFLAVEGRGVDLLWSSAMDLQIKLVNDGHALSYRSPQAAALPAWANWRNEAYGTTWEPVAFAINRERIAPERIPTTHAALIALLRSMPELAGRLATYDIERSALGFLMAYHDAVASADLWELAQLLGASRATLHEDSRAMLADLASGRCWIAYNVLGAYAEEQARSQPQIEVIYPGDYTLIVSRVAMIARQAANPVGARLWLDYLLSAAGQQLLSDRGPLYALRDDVPVPRSARGLDRRLGGAARPIALGPGLLAHLDRSTREQWLRRWRRAFEGRR